MKASLVRPAKGRVAMITQIVVRRAGIVDLEQCAQLVKEWMDETVWLNHRPSFSRIKSIVGENLARQEIWVAGEEIDAYMAVDPELSHICALYSREKNQGIGKALLDEAKKGRTTLTVNTHRPNLRAQRFYAREGFFTGLDIPAIAPETVPELRMEWRK